MPLLAAVALLLVGLTPAPPALGASPVVVIGESLSPQHLEVAPGTTVTWRNDSGNRHRIRSTSGPDEFDSGNLEPGQAFTFSFSALGTYAYRDERDPEATAFHGTVTVTTSPSGTPAPGATATPAPQAAAEVRMANSTFRPASLTVDAGTAVRFVNDDDRDHTVTASAGGFNSGLLGAGSTWTRTFSTPGTFGYLCAFHPDMTGTIAVRSSSGGTPPPAPAPTPAPAATPRPTAAPGTTRVAARDNSFAPATIDITAGTTVTWVNEGIALHTVTAGDGTFESTFIPAGGTFSRRFPQPGTFPYICTIHPGMSGTVRVSGADGAPPPSPAPAAVTPTPRPVTEPAPGSGVVAVVDFDYTPRRLSVGVGSTLRWVNQGIAPHTVTTPDGTLDSGYIAPGGSWSQTFRSAGTFAYLCTLHPQMTGTIEVVDGAPVTQPGGAAPSSAPNPDPTATSEGPGASPPTPTSAPGDGATHTGDPGDAAALPPDDTPGGGAGLPVARAPEVGAVARGMLVLALATAAAGMFALVVRRTFGPA
jgi:plastocyanin